jgi:hypothetical protein
VLQAQQAYVRKLIDTVNDLGNVLYEISNESDPSSLQWQYKMINYVKNYEAEKPNHHPVGMTIPWCKKCTVPNSILFNSPADWVSPGVKDGYKDNPPANKGSQIIINDTDHLWGGGGTIEWVWKSFTQGLNPIFMDDLGKTGIGGLPIVNFDPAWYAVRTGMTQTAHYAKRVDLRTAKPSGHLASTGYMLANLGVQYLALAPHGGGFTVNLSRGAGAKFSVEWLNVSDSSVLSGGTVSGGSSVQIFTPPFDGPAVLFLNRI